MLYAAVIIFRKHAGELHIVILKKKRVGNPYVTSTHPNVTEITSAPQLQKYKRPRPSRL